MSATLQTLLAIFFVIIISIRFITTLPQPIITPHNVSLTSKILEVPYIKNGKQIIKVNQAITIIAPVYPSYHYGDVLKVTGQINEKRIISNPKIIKQGESGNWLKSKLYTIREHAEIAFEKHLPQDSAVLTSGMLIGTKKEFSDLIEETLLKTGTVHMIVVSGYNITLVTSTLLKIAGFVHRRIAIICAIVFAALFVILTGAEPPALRAGIMASIVLLGQYYGRPSSTIRTLIFTIFITLSIWPQLLLSLSFQLSSAATFGIITLNKPLNIIVDIVCSPLKKLFHIPSDLRDYIKSEFITSLSAQLAVAPLILNSFGSLSIISPLANISVSWLIPYIMLSGLTLFLAEYIWPPLAMLFSFVLYPITALFLQVLVIFSKIPKSFYGEIKINSYIAVSFYMFMASLIALFSGNKKYSDNVDNKKRENE